MAMSIEGLTALARYATWFFAAMIVVVVIGTVIAFARGRKSV